jgi:carbonic anhydrase
MASPESEAALSRMLEGNRRFVAGTTIHPHQSADRRREISAAQAPFAALVECSDSRISTSVIFDCGLGDLFDIRTAGHVLGEAGLGSVHYALEHLKVPLVLVMGHSGCGAVAAAIGDIIFPGALGTLVSQISPAVAEARCVPGDLSTQAAQIHTRRTVRWLRVSAQVLRGSGPAGDLLIAGAYYDLATGVVELLPE